MATAFTVPSRCNAHLWTGMRGTPIDALTKGNMTGGQTAHLKSCMLEVSCLPVSRLSLPSP